MPGLGRVMQAVIQRRHEDVAQRTEIDAQVAVDEVVPDRIDQVVREPDFGLAAHQGQQGRPDADRRDQLLADVDALGGERVERLLGVVDGVETPEWTQA